MAARLGPEGTFEFAAPTAPGPYPIITPQRAGELALAFARTAGQFLGPTLERRRGGPIDFERLEVSGRVYFAQSPYRPAPPDVFLSIRRELGPHYLVFLQNGGIPVLGIAVSAYDTDLDIVDGSLRKQHLIGQGEEFLIQAVPVTFGHVVPITPEAAAAFVATELHAKVAEVPELVMPDRSLMPQLSRWRFRLDRPVRVRVDSTGEVRISSEVYVGLETHGSDPKTATVRLRFLLPAETQPPSTEIREPIFPSTPDERITHRRRVLELTGALPVVFQAATADPGR